MSAPFERTYKAGSIIYFEGDHGDEIYVLKSGAVILNSTSVIDGSDHKENVGKGQFFGVRSVLANYGREETAQVLTDAMVLVFKIHSFGALCLKNPRIVLQMLKAFSAHLRRVHKEVQAILGQKDASDPATDMIRVAEYYYKEDKKDYAMYVYQKYIAQFPEARFVGRANKMLANLKQGMPYPLGLASIDDELRNNAAAGAGF